MELFPRKCDNCNEGMQEGYVWDVGYACSDECLYVDGYTKKQFKEDYEMDNFGEVYTDLSDSEKVVIMYVYILGEDIVYNYENEVNN